MKKIALIEDIPDNRLLIRVLIDDRYALQEYENGPDGLTGIRRTKPDLVLLDISLPGMDGTEVLKEIRADSDLRGLPVLALTAHAMRGDREKFLAMGFDAYIAKPIEDESLLFDAISECLNRPITF
jgi:two-component system, cell cycle response regulator DivK